MKTQITVVLDRSGSMGQVCDDAIGGFNTFLARQQEDADGTTLTLVQFDHEYTVVCTETPVAEVDPLTRDTYVPRGQTALNDAIGRTIVELDERLARSRPDDRPERVLFVVLTDGYENASEEFSTDRVRRLIELHEQKPGWTFVYLAADVDAFAEGGLRGIAAARAYSFSKGEHGTARAFERMSDRAAEYKRGAEFAFTDEDRKGA